MIEFQLFPWESFLQMGISAPWGQLKITSLQMSHGLGENPQYIKAQSNVAYDKLSDLT